MLAMTSTGGTSTGGDRHEIADAAEWLRVYDSIVQAQEEMSNELNDAQQRGVGNRMKRNINKRVIESRDTLMRLERSLHSMERQPMKFKIGDGEIQRRKGMLTQVRMSNDSLDDQVNNNGGRLAGNMARKAPSLADESNETQNHTNAQLLTQQRSAISRQDEKLDGILDGVSRLKVMSSDINQELDLHANLLTELDGAVESTDARLQRNTRRIDIVSEQSGGCCGLIIMIVLFAIIVMLLVTNWGCKLPNAKC